MLSTEDLKKRDAITLFRDAKQMWLVMSLWCLEDRPAFTPEDFERWAAFKRSLEDLHEIIPFFLEGRPWPEK